MTAAGIMYLTGGRVLLLHRAASSVFGGTWGFPAGGPETGETPAQTAIRESFEETGHAPENALALVAESSDFVLFECRGDVFNPVLNPEHDGYLWASPDALPAPLHPGIAERLQVTAMDESARLADVNGWVEIKGNPISKAGIFPYAGRQIPGATDPDRLYQVLRPAQELADPECIASFRLLPWIDNHVMLGAEELGMTPPERKGIDGVIGEEIYFEGDTLFANLKVFSQTLANLIEAGKRELSCGYRCTYEWAPGTFEGQAYDVVQRQIRGNHLALVDSGRMGPDVAVLDGASALDQFTFALDVKEPSMAEGTENEGGSTGEITLADALKFIEQATPVFAAIQKLAAAATTGATETTTEGDDPGTVADPDPAATDADPSPDGKGDKEDKGAAMDSAATFKAWSRQLAERNRLAEQLSAHVGTFDASDMTTQEVAVYGLKKLEISCAKGAELATLQGYLRGKGDPRKQAVATAAADAAPGDNFVTRHLNKKGS